MKRAAMASIGVTGMLIACLPATPAAAAPGYYVSEAGHVTRFHLQGSNGYQISVSSSARRYFTLTTRKAGVETEYTIRGRQTNPYGVRAMLPGLGRVDVRFAPSGRKRQLEASPNCDGRGPTIQAGTVRGQVLFRGEEGYTEVRAHRIAAEVVNWTKQRCRYVEAEQSRRAKRLAARFSAVSSFGAFSARQYRANFRPRSRRVVFTASTGSKMGRLWVFRSVSVSTDLASFRRPGGQSNPEHLVLEPPPPFSGTGTFQRTPESIFTWDGTLNVMFPGLSEPLQLAGPRFDTRYCALRGCINQFGPEGPGFL